MPAKKLIAILISIGIIGSCFNIFLVHADESDESYDYLVEAESANEMVWLSTGGAAIQNNPNYSGGKYLNLFYPSDGVKEWYAEYKINIEKEGVYAMDIASTPLTQGWSSQIYVSVNGEEPNVLKGSQFKSIPGDSSIAWYHTNVILLQQGINTIRFIVKDPRAQDGNVTCFFDCFTLKRGKFGLYAISSNAPMQAFQQGESIGFNVEAQGAAPEDKVILYEVLDYKGKMVQAGKTYFRKGDTQIPITLQPARNGAYQLLVSMDGQSLVKQFIVVPNMSERKYVKDSPFAVDALPYGMRTDINSALSEDYADLIALSGVQWIRDRVYFDPFVKKNGNTWEFSMPHTAITGKQLNERNVKVNMTMDLMPAVLRTNSYGVMSPTNLFDIYSFWKALAENYDGAVNCWEIGNEVDLGGGGSNLDGADTYASMFKAAALGIIDSNTNNEVFVSPQGAAARPGHTSQYTELLYENDIYNYTNIVNWHNHISATPEYKNYYEAPVSGAEGHMQLQQEHNITDVCNWDGEAGISMDIPSTRDYYASEQMVQAKYLVTSFVEDIAAGADKRFFFDGMNFQEGGKAWGMTSRGKVSPSAYAAWASLSGMTYVLGEGKYINKVKDVPENIAAYVFSDGTDDVIVFWSTREDSEKVAVSFQVGYEEATQYDIFANAKRLYSANGTYEFVVDGEPVYLKVNGKIQTEIVSNEEVRVQHQMPDGQKQVSDADRVVLLQQYGDMQRNGARLGGYQLTDDVNVVKVAVYNFNNHAVSGKVIGSSQTGWEIEPLEKEINIEPMSMQEVIFEIIPDGFKGQEDRITFYADLDCGTSTRSTIWANSRKVVDAVPLIKDGITNIRLTIENRQNVAKTVNYVKVNVDGNEVEQIEQIIIEPKSSKNIDVPVEIDQTKNTLDISADVGFTDGNSFSYSNSIPFSIAMDKIDLSSQPNFILPDDGSIVSNMYYGEDDLYAKVWLAADTDNFYMTVIAKDNLHSGTCADGSLIWNDDSIQFALAQGLPDSGAKYYEFGMSLNDKLGSYMYCWIDGFGNGKIGQFKEADCKITRDDENHTTTYELILPWASISPISFDDNLISFSMLINDNDGMGRTGYLEWGSGIGSTKDPGSFRTVLFKK